MSGNLVLRAGPDALRLLRERGLRAEDVAVVPGASGGPKWLVLAGLDRWLWGDFLRGPRHSPVHGIGSSIGSWRLACAAQRDPMAAFDRARRAYVEQTYPPKPSVAYIGETAREILGVLLGDSGVDEILTHPWLRLHVVTAESRHAVASERYGVQAAALAVAAAGNVLARRTLALHVRRVIFHADPAPAAFTAFTDFPTRHLPLTRETLAPALLASGAIPLLFPGVRIPGDGNRVHRDGGVIDYHLAVDYGRGDGLVLYPHFYPHLVPGWFDKSLPWRRGRGAGLRRTLVIAPSPDWVARIPGGRIPDRGDFNRLDDATRIRTWYGVVAAAEQLADEMRELVALGPRIAERVQPID
ncbi:MAG: patatin-like phospholipase family protein [Gemmatimonadaceae bacterium]|jgi:hypothetical protein|nr:patatin-like phospholipase family protein [Gemmatimonadaceae bacterium]